MVTLLSQTLMKLFVVCVMIGVRTFAFLTFSFIFLLFYVPCVRFHDNNNRPKHIGLHCVQKGCHQIHRGNFIKSEPIVEILLPRKITKFSIKV